MKPRTKKKKLLVEYSAKLPSITEAQRNYPKEHIFKKKGLYMKKGLVWCQYCGHEYKINTSSLAVSLDVGSEFCPCCGKELHLEHYTGKHNNEGVCYMVVTTYKGFQVLRCFDTTRNNTRGKATHYTCDEMFQLWIDEKGRETILTKKYKRSPFHLSWDYNSEFHIGRHNASCAGYYQYADLFDISGYYSYPRMTVTPLLRRNGWRNHFAFFHGVSVAELMRALISNSDIEMLAKTGQASILTHWMHRGWHRERNREKDFFDSIKICNRNHYIVQDASLWYDMLDALRYLGLDTHNAHYVCPDDLNAAHDLYIKRMRRQKEKDEREQRRKENVKNEADFRRKKGKYLGIVFGNENMTISVLQSVEDYFVEGQAMHHCVAGYFNKDWSLCLSARDKENKRLATIELSLRNYKVMQCRAACNAKPERYDEIVKLVESHANDFRKAKSKKLKPCKQ